ncbi:MAG TPA: hypothetical protein VIK89_05800 [Cytophagaceae bacterium]
MHKAERSFFKKVLGSVMLLSVELIAVWGVLLVSVLTFLLLSREIFIQDQEGFDGQVFEFLNEYITTSNTHIMKMFSFLLPSIL